MREIIQAQGGDPDIRPENIKIGPAKFAVKSASRGTVYGINNSSLAAVCRAAGTPKDAGAGILLNKKIGDSVKKGDVLFTIYSEKTQKLNQALKISKSLDMYSMMSDKAKMLMEKVV